jgi:hypothetical protein
MSSPRFRSGFVVAALLVLAGAIGVGVIAGTSHHATEPVRGPGSSGAPGNRDHPQRAPGVKVCQNGPRAHTIPAEIMGRHASSISTSILVPTNAWLAADCRTLTWIYAGAAGRRPSAGLLVIARVRGESSHERDSYIVLPRTGAIRITHAPLGPGLVTSAQTQGHLGFRGKHGETGTLDLEDDTATLSNGEVIHASNHTPNG